MCKFSSAWWRGEHTLTVGTWQVWELGVESALAWQQCLRLRWLQHGGWSVSCTGQNHCKRDGSAGTVTYPVAVRIIGNERFVRC